MSPAALNTKSSFSGQLAEEKRHYHLNHSKAERSPASSETGSPLRQFSFSPENLKLERAYEIPVWGTDTVSFTPIQTPSSDEAFVSDLRSLCQTAQAQA